MSKYLTAIIGVLVGIIGILAGMFTSTNSKRKEAEEAERKRREAEEAERLRKQKIREERLLRRQMAKSIETQTDDIAPEYEIIEEEEEEEFEEEEEEEEEEAIAQSVRAEEEDTKSRYSVSEGKSATQASEIPQLEIHRFTDEELERALQQQIRTKKLPPYEIREPLIYYARKKNIYKIMNEEYDMAARIDEVIAANLKSLKDNDKNDRLFLYMRFRRFLLRLNKFRFPMRF